jgi:hypothetical protein
LIPDPAIERVHADLADPSFMAGLIRQNWRVAHEELPLLLIELHSTEPDGSQTWYGFRFELSNYPGQAPDVRIWDIGANQPLPVPNRPKGNAPVEKAFQQWQPDVVYRPWERSARDHNNFHTSFPHLAWHSDRKLSFILEDLSELLNLNARKIDVP